MTECSGPRWVAKHEAVARDGPIDAWCIASPQHISYLADRIFELMGDISGPVPGQRLGKGKAYLGIVARSRHTAIRQLCRHTR